jgi:diguanylate cyclase (GGDEF)-like protein
MISPPLPSNERQRLATLRSLKILDTPAEERFDRITRIARRLFDVPIALGSLCLIDRRPRTISSEDLTTLRELGRLIEAELVAMNLATSDALTGVSNLRGFVEIGHHVLALSTRFGHSLQLLVVKIPRIIEFYRTQGLAGGERALVDVAQILLSSFRESDLVARIGEDEFGVLLMGRETTWTDPALQRVEELLDDLNVYRSKELRIVAKVVSETFDPKRHGSLQDLIAAAETRLG